MAASHIILIVAQQNADENLCEEPINHDYDSDVC